MSPGEATMSITDFLLARIAEDETWAQKSFAPQERGWDAKHWLGDYDEDPVDGTTQNGLTAVGDEITWLAINPSRVLAECAAKRRLVELHCAEDEGPWQGFCVSCGNDTGPNEFPCDTIKVLAAVYQSHPDYRQEWAS